MDEDLLSKEKLPAGAEEAITCPETGSGPSCKGVSIKSNKSIGRMIDFKHDDVSHQRLTDQTTNIREQNVQQHDLDVPSLIQLLEKKFNDCVKEELKTVQRILMPDHPEHSQGFLEKVLDDKSEETKIITEEFRKISICFLKTMGLDDLAQFLQSRCLGTNCQKQLKRNLQRKFRCVPEGIAESTKFNSLDQIYTELYITEGGSQLINEEHEVRQIEKEKRKLNRPESSIRPEDFFKAVPKDNQSIRTMLTKGVAGIGKTILTQKLTLDWAENTTHPNIDFLFPFTFKELNLVKEKTFSLVGLIHHFFPETREVGMSSLDQFQILIILDGLDECRLPLDFTNNHILTSAIEPAPLDVLLTNLVTGQLLPSAYIWITTRPAAAVQIPPQYVDMVTEVRGFTDLQKEEYLRKRYDKTDLASKIISHIKACPSIYIMCHIPVFCWISATVLEDALKSGEVGDLPKTLTELYIHFLVVQSKLKNMKYYGGAKSTQPWNPDNQSMIESLGKLAFDHLKRGNFIFYDGDLCGMDLKAASCYSGLFTQIFKEERGLYRHEVFCFIHLSVQEFLAALHVHLTFVNSGVNLLSQEPLPADVKPDPGDFYLSAINEALMSPNGHLDLFLRFLLGLSLENNQTMLKGLMTPLESRVWTSSDTADLIKEKINKNVCPERMINLFHCLNELQDSSLVEEVQQQLRSGQLSDQLSPVHWSALVFILLSIEKHLDIFDLEKYLASEEALEWLLPVVQASNRVLLRHCGLSEMNLTHLSSVLSSPASCLTLLDLSDNQLTRTGLKLLSEGLESPECHLETLRLRSCGLSEVSCLFLSSVLGSSSCHLKELDLSDNDLHDVGISCLCRGMESPNCQLEVLSLSGCLVTEDGCSSLASALSKNPSHLLTLDISYNHPQGQGLDSLSAGLQSVDWKLNNITKENCGPQRLTPGLKKYSCELTLDPNTAHRRLQLSEDSTEVKLVKVDQVNLYHPERFCLYTQLMCKNGLTSRCYWEVKWSGNVFICVAYRRNKMKEEDCVFGENQHSWSLKCSHNDCKVFHNKKSTSIRTSTVSERVGVYVDWHAGVLTFYNVSSNTLIHLHTFYTTFTEPLYPAFRLWKHSDVVSSVSLCRLTEVLPE